MQRSACRLDVSGCKVVFPTTAQLLISGGDARIALDPDSGLNKYGCRPYPDPALLAFGSSTASTISEAGYAAVNRLRERLLQAVDADTLKVFYESERQRIRRELLELAQVSDLGVELVFATSGTDAHLIAAQYAAADHPLRVVMVAEDETGSGVAAVLSALDSNGLCRMVPLRANDGTPRPIADIDTDVTAWVIDAVTLGQRVLLIMVDQSKTGLIAPSPACVMQLHQCHRNQVDVLVDACQFRLAPATLRAYLQQGFMVALTGSKFLTGPSFSAALLRPAAQRRTVRTGEDSGEVNFGLLLRWEAALVELRRFGALPQDEVVHCLEAFVKAVQHRLINDPCFAPLAVPQLDRRPLIEARAWDHLPTIFPFLLCHPQTRLPLSREETLRVYRQLPMTDGSWEGIAALRCQLGQPVACGMRDGMVVSALRLCISAGQISDACEKNDTSGLIEEAMRALDKAARLVALPNG